MNTYLKAAILLILCFFCCGITSNGLAQCPNRLTAISGTEHFDCTDVTVTSTGSFGACPGWNCGFCNYFLGETGTSSCTFTFSSPISGVLLDIEVLDHFDWYEEVAIEINGAPFFIPDPTDFDDCMGVLQMAIVTPDGHLAAPPISWAGAKGLYIDQTITTLTIRDLWFFGTPLGVTMDIYFCCSSCLTNAGVLSAPMLNLCPDQPAQAPSTTHTYLESGDIIQYVLFSDLNDTLGSIVAIRNAPNFAFDPANMQTDSPYYLAAIAGQNTGGQVDLTDNCLDFSNAIEVIWHPFPTVSFQTENPDLCAGSCKTIEATFTGAPPFSLTYTVPGIGAQTQAFPSETGTFQICAPDNVATNNVMLKAVSVTDARCTCH